MKKNNYSNTNDRGVVVAAIITSLIIFAFITFKMYKYIVYLNDNKLVPVPDLHAELYDDVVEKYMKDFDIVAVDEQLSSVYEVGTVISQNIEPNTMARKGTKIEVSITSNPNNLIMPELEARTLKDATKTLEKYKVKIETYIEESEIIEAGYIIRTSPSYEEKIKVGQTVKLYISSGSSKTNEDEDDDDDEENDEENLEDDDNDENDSKDNKESSKNDEKVPSFIGLTEKQAREKAEKIGMKVEKIEYQNGASSTNGTVSWQSVKKDTPVSKINKINFLIITNDNEEEDILEEEEEIIETRLVTVSVAPDFELTSSSYLVEIVMQDSTGTRPIYKKEHVVADFPFEKKFNVEVGGMVAVYIGDRLVSEENIK